MVLLPQTQTRDMKMALTSVLLLEAAAGLGWEAAPSFAEWPWVLLWADLAFPAFPGFRRGGQVKRGGWQSQDKVRHSLRCSHLSPEGDAQQTRWLGTAARWVWVNPG